MLAFDNVSKIYPNGHVGLRNVSFELGTGEMAFLTGHSGAGKSTLLKLIAKMEDASQGEVSIDTIKLSKLSPRKVPKLRRSLGVVFQDPKLLSDYTIFENVALPLTVAGFAHTIIAKRVRAALDKVGLLRRENCYPSMLSGGEQQRIGIARAIVHKPKLILADEPTGNLDPELSRDIIKLFMDFNQVGVTVLIASHDIDLINTFKPRVLNLQQGRLVRYE